jgi:hypothetical protein
MNARLQKLYEENPSEFRRVMAEALKRTVIPHAGQVPVLESQARFKVMNCGRRFGKTVLAAKIMTMKARKSDQMLWWVAPTYRIVKRGYVEVLKQLPAGSLRKAAPPASNFDAGRAVILEFKNGTTMEFYSAERPEGMLGAAVDFAVLDEAARMKADVWQETVSPTLIDHLGGCLIISTPRGRNWFYDVWRLGQPGGDPEYESWTFITDDNPTLPPGEAARMAATMPKSKADQEIYAKWLAAGSAVFLLEEQAKQDSAIKPSGLVEGEGVVKNHHVFLGVDLARTNDWTVLYGERDDGYNVFFERMQDVAWAEQRRRIRRAVSILRNAGATGVTLMIDEGNGQTTTVEDLQDGGYDAIGINFTTKKAHMVRLLANDLERGATSVLDDPEYGVLEFENYAMDVTPTGRYTYAAPEGQHDDVVSAKMLAHWGAVNEGSGAVQIIDADETPVQRAAPTESPLSADTDPWGDMEEFEGDSWDDLIDDDPDLEDPQRAAAAVGLVAIDLTRPPSAQELLLRDDVWG